MVRRISPTGVPDSGKSIRVRPRQTDAEKVRAIGVRIPQQDSPVHRLLEAYVLQRVGEPVGGCGPAQVLSLAMSVRWKSRQQTIRLIVPRHTELGEPCIDT